MGKAQFTLDSSSLKNLMATLYRLEHEMAKDTIAQLLVEGAEKINAETERGMGHQFLPARGRYSTGQTEGSIVDTSAVHWEGGVAWVPIGFDFSKPGAGGYLISGTPKMRPDPVLNKLYKGKTFMNQVDEEMFDKLNKKIQEIWDSR